MEETDRDFARADELLDMAEKLAPDNPSILLQRAVVRGRTREYDKALSLLDGIAAKSRGGTLGPNELLEKGRLLDKMGRFDEAFAAFAEGKRETTRLSGNAYLADHAAQLAARLKRYFTASRLKIVPRAGVLEDGAATAVHCRLSALQHLMIAGADPVSLIPRILRRVTNLPMIKIDINGFDAAHAQFSPHRLSLKPWPTLDGRSARGAGESPQLLPAARAPARCH